MTARSEVLDILQGAAARLNNDPAQQLAALSGDGENYNVNVANSRLNALQEALLLLADKIDRAS